MLSLSERDRGGAGIGQTSSFHKVCTDCNVQRLPGRWIEQIFKFRGPKSSPEVRGVLAPPLQGWALPPSMAALCQPSLQGLPHILSRQTQFNKL